jgi:hypothetical protein
MFVDRLLRSEESVSEGCHNYRDLDHFISAHRQDRQVLLARAYHDGWKSSDLDAIITRQGENLFFRRNGERSIVLGRRLPNALLTTTGGPITRKGDEFEITLSDGRVESLGVHQFDEWWTGRDGFLILRRGDKLISVDSFLGTERELTKFKSVSEIWAGAAYGPIVRVENELYLVIT